jgi:ribonuclease J
MALGGMGEIGMNCAILECKGSIVIIDCGVSFTDDEAFGVDVLLPDFDWLIDRVDKIEGLIITHGHQDHIGGAAWLLEQIDIPVFAPRFAVRMLQASLKERNLLEESQLEEYDDSAPLELGPFKFEFLRVNHSIPDAYAFCVQTPIGRLFHTADFKIDSLPYAEPPMDIARLNELCAPGVRAMFSDSTNVERKGSAGSEAHVAAALSDHARNLQGRMVVTMFSTNVFRIQALVQAAEATGRKLMILGRSLQTHTRVAREVGIIKVNDPTIFVDLTEWKSIEPGKLIVACTGSQGQPMAALPRMLAGRLQNARLEKGDAVLFSARVIPGNEPTVGSLKDAIIRLGARVIDTPEVHVSGHAFRDELALMMRMVKPREVVPVHGYYRFLHAHSELAKSVGIERTHILDNGDILEFTPDATVVREHIEFRKVAASGEILDFVDGPALKDRALLASRGLVVIGITVDDSGLILESPSVVNRGAWQDNFVDSAFTDDLTEQIRAAVAAVRSRPDTLTADVRDAAFSAARRFLKHKLQRRPFLEVVVGRA